MIQCVTKYKNEYKFVLMSACKAMPYIFRAKNIPIPSFKREVYFERKLTGDCARIYIPGGTTSYLGNRHTGEHNVL